MGSIRVVNDESHFQSELAGASTRLVVVDFTASWCGPCQRIAPVFQQLASKYSKAVFLKVDVDKCQETAASQGVSAMPTFIFYRNKTKVDRLQGADATALENKIQQYYGTEDGDEAETVSGHETEIKTEIEEKAVLQEHKMSGESKKSRLSHSSSQKPQEHPKE